jgi:hypothetical protein
MMTTGWGSEPDRAPAIAYELTALVAEGSEELTAKLWAGLDRPLRARVVAALGAQARCSAWETAGQAALAVQFTETADMLPHCAARGAVLRALAGRPDGALPACDGCPRAAVALARARLAILAAAGFAPEGAAEICRRTARRP